MLISYNRILNKHDIGIIGDELRNREDDQDMTDNPHTPFIVRHRYVLCRS